MKVIYRLYTKDKNVAGGHWVEYASWHRDCVAYRVGSFLWAIEEAEYLAKKHDRVMVYRQEIPDGAEVSTRER